MGDMKSDGLIHGLITEDSLDLMRERIGYPNPTLRGGLLAHRPWVSELTDDAIYHYAMGVGDNNPLYWDQEYCRASRWGTAIAPPGIEMAMGWNRNAEMAPDRAKATSKALRGVHLFYSGCEHYYWRPVATGTKLFKAEWVDTVEPKVSKFGGKSVIVTNGHQWWDEHESVHVSGNNWFVHTERRKLDKSEAEQKKKVDEPGFYSDEEMAKIEAAYDAEYVRGKDTLYYEDVEVGQQLPTMVKGPFTITDLFNLHLGAGWLTYGNPPFRLAYENRKLLRGFYSKDQHGTWDTVQRIHWDLDAAHSVGVLSTYDIGSVRQTMVNNYLTNFAGDDGFVHYSRCEFRNFNFVGDVTWLTGKVKGKRIDPHLGALIEVEIAGTNQRGKENIRGGGIILVATREGGQCKLPEPPPVTRHRRKD